MSKSPLVVGFVRGTASGLTGQFQRLLVDPKFQAAQEFIAKDHDRFVRETIQITEIEAPPFKEAKRAKAFVEMMRQRGMSDVEIDDEGNGNSLRRRIGPSPLIAMT